MDEERIEAFREMRDGLDDDVSEIVRWQMTGMLLKKAPVHRRPIIPKCHNCGDEWHGLMRDGCPGAFNGPDTPKF